ncbi:MAG: chorismate mutase [Ruminococcus sp.]|jgi:chorismate mutase/prephenate dehydratase|nr:chorismate mutase [Ruminococcus sp.]
MELEKLRSEIDKVDDEILSLFSKRMEIVTEVAKYKHENALPVMQGGREAQIVSRVRENSPAGLENASEMLFVNMMDISKCMQTRKLFTPKETATPKFIPAKIKKIACQGSFGAYSEIAAERLFPNAEKSFYPSFTEVFSAVECGTAECGILPIQNSNVGSIAETYDLMAKHDFFINAVIRTEADHCLCALRGADISNVKTVISKAEAIGQCAAFIKSRGFSVREYANTALAAEYVAATGDKTLACICSKRCAALNGLEIIAEGIADVSPNFTRFICFSKAFSEIADADTVSVSLAIPHTKGSLYRLLTKFAVSGLNLVKIENKAVGGSDFEVIFYLDFAGRYSDFNVLALLDDLKNTLSYFRFLGSFKEVI